MNSSHDALLPIREVARLTGVNAVTLRAWERRYGLIEPHRTEKGHRLYTQTNLEQVRAILTWLSRGVNVGQVKGLLAQAPASQERDCETPFGFLRSQLLDGLRRFDMSDFERLFARIRNRYSSQTLSAELFEPILEQLRQCWHGQFGSQLEEVFFHGWLRDQVVRWVQDERASSGRQRIVLASLSAEHCEPELWLLCASLTAAGFDARLLEWEFPASELTLMLDAAPACAAVFFSSQALPAHQLRRHLPKLRDRLPDRLFVAGPAAVIHREAWGAIGLLALGSRPSEIHSELVRTLGGFPDA